MTGGVILLANDCPWPSVNGGRARLAGLCGVLGDLGEVQVLVARNRHRSVDVVPPAQPLPRCDRSRVGALLGFGPRLGRGLLDAGSVAEALRRAAGSSLLVVSHSYLAPPVVAHSRVPVVVDFPNLEVDRQGRGLGGVEAAKARWWEPRVARRAALCIAVDEADAEALRRWGAQAVVVVPNAAEVTVAGPSPDEGPLLAVADWTYGPNRHSVDALLALDLPLVLAGRGSEAWPQGRGWVADLDPLYAEAAAVLAPARTGAGTQLKVVEALCRGRVVVTTEHGARSVPPAAREACWVGDLAEGAAAALGQVAERHRREQVLREADLPRSWGEAARPLAAALRGLLS